MVYTSEPGVAPNSINPDLQFLVAKSTNTNYLVKIQALEIGLEIVADMPESMAYAVGSEWENRLPSSSTDLGPIADGIAAVTGTNATVQGLTKQVWQGTSPIEIPVTLLFDAEKSALQEVYKPLRILEALVLPKIVAGLLVAPGPVGSGNGSGINLTIGNTLSLSNMILTSCSTTYNTRLDSSGYPIAGQAELTFKTHQTYGKADWLRASNLSETLLVAR